jgi:hypothetical protein
MASSAADVLLVSVLWLRGTHRPDGAHRTDGSHRSYRAARSRAVTAQEFDPNATYYAGDLVIYNGSLYQVNVDHPTGNSR